MKRPLFKIKKHLFDINLYSLKAYNDYRKSKLHRVLFYLGLDTSRYDSPIGINIWLSSPKDFNEEEIKRANSKNLSYLAGKCKTHLFQYTEDITGKKGRFLGILVTQEDYYYILMDNEGNKWYVTCVSKLKFIKND